METATDKTMFNFNKKGRVVEATVKVKNTTLKADLDITLLSIAAIMISLINVVYILGIF
jgi:hypothetical protein